MSFEVLKNTLTGWKRSLNSDQKIDQTGLSEIEYLLNKTHHSEIRIQVSDCEEISDKVLSSENILKIYNKCQDPSFKK